MACTPNTRYDLKLVYTKNMKQKPLIIVMIVVFLFLLLGASAFALKSYNDAKAQKAQRDLEMLQAPNQTETTQSEPISSKEKIQGSLFDLFNRGSNLNCTFSGTQAEQDISGTIYISGKKMRGTFEIEMPQATITSNMVSDGEYMYSWSDLLPQGFKMKLSEVEAQANAEVTDPKLSKEALENMKKFQQNFDYECDKWAVDSSMFNVPGNVTFTDYSLLMPTGGNNVDIGADAGEGDSSDSGANMCGTCNIIPDPDAKSACLTNFKCN